MSPSSVLPVVVGVDGAPCSVAAVGVAAMEAARRHRPLHIVHVLARTASPLAGLRVAGPPATPDPRDVLDEAAGLAALRHPDLAIVTHLVEGSPAVALLDASSKAALTVVGSRGLGGFTGLLLGSTAAQVATHGRCPVMVVRGAVQPDAPVLLAVDALHPVPNVTGFAFQEAALREVPLHALFGWTTVRRHPGSDPLRPVVDDFRAGELEAERLLAEVLAGWSAEFPDVKLTPEVQHTLDPSRTIVEASAAAGLVVVGSHRRNDLRGVLLGSAAYTLVHRSECPVAVVHPDDQPGAA